MDPTPPEPVVPLSPVSSAAYTDVLVDPASVHVDQPIDPAPAVLADEEMESDPEEDLQMGNADAEDDEESSHRHDTDAESEDTAAPMDVQNTSPAPAVRARSPSPSFFVEYLPRFGGPRTVRTSRKRVHHPYGSTSRVRPRTLASPPQGSPSLDRAIREHRFTHEPPSSPSSSSSSSAAASTTPAQGVAAATPTASDAAAHQHGQDPMDIETIAEDLLEVKDAVIRIEGTLATIPGPDNFDDMERMVGYLDRRADNREARSFAFERRTADRFQDLRIRQAADRREIRYLRDMVQYLEDQLRVLMF